MTTLRDQLHADAAELQVEPYLIEADYVMTWILTGIAMVPELRHGLIFKGGTALQKCFFEDYRLSRDIDFTARPALDQESMRILLRQIIGSCNTMMRDVYTGFPHAMIVSLAGMNPKPSFETFALHCDTPWGLEITTYLEVSFDAVILSKTQTCAINHSYSGIPTVELDVFPLHDIITDKLRAILEITRQLQASPNTRLPITRSRDYYDIWRVLSASPERLDLPRVIDLLRQKCILSGVSYNSVEDFLDPLMVSRVEYDWQQSLEGLVPNRALPPFSEIETELRPLLEQLLQTGENDPH